MVGIPGGCQCKSRGAGGGEAPTRSAPLGRGRRGLAGPGGGGGASAWPGRVRRGAARPKRGSGAQR